MARLKTLKEIEREAIINALIYYKGNLTYTSKALKISITSLKDKAREYRSMGFEVPFNLDSAQVALINRHKKLTENKTE
jgi:DNA-binding NtrC family response regulator